MSGANALWLLWGFSKVTRRKGGTLSGRYRKNGYALDQKNGTKRKNKNGLLLFI
jgi:hypothetical protein